MNHSKAQERKETLLLHGNYLASLIASSLRQEQPQEHPRPEQWEETYRLAVHHGITALSYKPLRELRNPPSRDLMTRWKERYERAILRDLIHTVARERLFETLREHHLDFIPLKGIHLRERYPIPALREMSDQDLLIREGQQEHLRPLMETLGYRLTARNNHHDTYQKDPSLTIEAHHRLLPQGSTGEDHLKGAWHRAGKERLSPLDEALYHTVHLYRHWSEAGTGLRSLADLTLLPPPEPELEAALEQTGLLSFHRSMHHLAKAVLEGRPLKPEQEGRFLLLLQAGTYGTPATAAYQGVLAEHRKGASLTTAKIRYLGRRLFPKPETLALRFQSEEGGEGGEEGGEGRNKYLRRLLGAFTTLPRHHQELKALTRIRPGQRAGKAAGGDDPALRMW